MEFRLPEYHLQMMLPEIFLFLWALVIIAVDLITKRRSASLPGYLALVGLAFTGLILAFTGYGCGFGSMHINDPLAVFFKVIFLGAAFMTVGCTFGITKKKITNHRGEFFGLILMSTVGMMFLASSSELISLYVGLELTTIPLFVLAAFFKDDRRSVEAGAKFFIIGAFSSALLLYGFSFLYGLSGTTDILQMRFNLAATQLGAEGDIGLVLILAIVVILAGLGFKLGLPPFHQWVPDVYEGAPTPITAFLSVASKSAGLVAFARIMVNGLYAYYEPIMSPNDWGILVGVLAAAGMIIGNVLAIRQHNIKRMLAYSSVAHAGYVMVGMVAMNSLGLSAVGFYMFAYLFANMGAFAVVTLFEDRTGSCEIPDYAGLSRTSPLLAVSLSVFLLSLTGIPPLAGFFGKYYVFAAAIKQAGVDSAFNWLYWVVGIGLLTSVIALFYYANVIRTMYFESPRISEKLRYSPTALAVIVIGLIGVFLFGIDPEPMVRFAMEIPVSHGFILP